MVAIGQFLIMLPAGMSMSTVTLVGNSLGSNRPIEAMENAKLATFVSTTVCLVLSLSIYIGSYTVIHWFGEEESSHEALF